ncbi:alpha/beta hydrolase [Chitinophaga sp.]|uniref:alpha/beta hydrolase n=1 Tax=Chitinophaga sp. TaxID=1869181 RepID=UPI002F942992
MEIIPQVQDALTFIHSLNVAPIEDKLQASRARYEKLIPLAGEEEAVFSVEDKTIGFTDRNVNIRIYRPDNKKVLPAVVYFHGGGFFKGSLATHDRPLRQLTNLSGVVVISVDYRLAPEYPFPHGQNDCIDTTEWIIHHAAELGIDHHRIAVAGDSAGGTLAMAVAAKLKNILCQILIYPLTDCSFAAPSWSTFAEGPIVTLKSANEFWKYYTAGKMNTIPLYDNDLSGVPDTFIISAEYDPLRDDAVLYAEKLRQAHVEVKEMIYPKMIHGFMQMGGVIEEGREVMAEIAAYVRGKLRF